MSNQNGFDSDEQEAYYREIYQRELEQEQEPDVIPCFKCNSQMYEINNNPELNLCDKCQKAERLEQKEGKWVKKKS